MSRRIFALVSCLVTVMFAVVPCVGVDASGGEIEHSHPLDENPIEQPLSAEERAFSDAVEQSSGNEEMNPPKEDEASVQETVDQLPVPIVSPEPQKVEAYKPIPTDFHSFITPFQVSQTDRIALTPHLTGSIGSEKWDLLSQSNDVTSYMQWEPGLIYGAARLPQGKDLIVTLEFQDRERVANDKRLELRFHLEGSTPRVTFRSLDRSNSAAPKWVEDSTRAKLVTALASQDGSHWEVEFKLLGASLPPIVLGSKVGLRYDAIDAQQESPVARIPRALTTVSLVMNRSVGMPGCIAWDALFKRARNVTFGEPILVHLSFVNTNKGNDPFKKVSLRTRGFDQGIVTTSTTQPFPKFSRRGRAHVNYHAIMPRQSSVGYRVLQAILEDKEGKTSTVEASYHMCEPLLFDIDLPAHTFCKEESQIIRGRVTLRSQSLCKLNGSFNLEAPEGWSVVKGRNKRFAMSSDGVARIAIQLIVPRGASGLIPLTYKANLGDRVVQKTVFYPIEKP